MTSANIIYTFGGTKGHNLSPLTSLSSNNVIHYQILSNSYKQENMNLVLIDDKELIKLDRTLLD